MPRYFPCFICVVLAACSAQSIPTYPAASPAQSLQILSERARQIKTVSSPAQITLTKPDGQTVRFDAAIVLQPPGNARIRAWKFNQAVFDMTITPQGVWIIAPNGDDRAKILAAGSNTGELVGKWLRLVAGTFDDPATTVEAAGSNLLVKQPEDHGHMMICQIDRKTLTPRRYDLLDKSGSRQFRLMLDDYAVVNSIAWPRKIQAISDQGQILIELQDVEINGELPAGVFQPPARAEKLP